MAWAHSKNSRGERHDLVSHLRAVGLLTGQFAKKFGAADEGYWLGLWHDLGKFDPKWQTYLLASEADPAGYHGRVDHKAAGTLLAFDKGFGTLAMLIHGHHGGLRAPVDFGNWVKSKQADTGAAEASRLGHATISDLEPPGAIEPPLYAREGPRAHELFLRMLFSALIDADRLDTERHTQVEHAAIRGADVQIAELFGRLDQDQRRFAAQNNSKVAQARDAVYRACLSAAEQPPGLFRLSVPTGGGKTRSAMAFALRHALEHGHERVIVAVPYVSITQQTAEVYRDIFGDSGDD